MTYELYAVTAAEALRQWDAGESVWSIEMGGLGPGYEQAIQVLAFEIIRDELGKELPEPGHADRWGDVTVHRVNDWPGCGFSGAQVGAAKFIAYRFLRDGPKAALEAYKKQEPDGERMIQVSRTWPHAPVAPQQAPA